MTATGISAFGSVWCAARWPWPPDDAPSRAWCNRDKTTAKPPGADTCLRTRKAPGGIPGSPP
jgi:hypothetical protein